MLQFFGQRQFCKFSISLTKIFWYIFYIVTKVYIVK